MKTFTAIAFTILFIAYCNAQPGAFMNLTAAQIKSSAQVKALVQAGLVDVIALGQAKHQFNSTNFTVTHVNSAAQQVVSGGSNYKLDVNYVNTKNESAHAQFTGFYNTTSGEASISSISYSVQYPKTTTTTTPTGTTTTTTTTTNNTTAPNTTSVSVGQLMTNDFIHGLFDFGFNNTIALGIKNGTIPKGNYTLSKVNSITQQNVMNGEVFNFNVLAKSTANTTVALAFIVRGHLDAYSWKAAK